MTPLQVEVTRLLAEADGASTSDAKGKHYEALLKYVFESVPGSLVIDNRKTFFKTEQIDLAVGHDGGFVGLPEHFLVECKNYDHPVDSKAVGYFLFIAISRGSKLAVLAAAMGLTGDSDDLTHAHSLATRASAMGCKIVVLSRSELEGLGQPDDLVALLRRRYLEAWSEAGIGV